jgi:hypothetical protein
MQAMSLVAAILSFQNAAPSAIDFSKIDRTIAKEPKYLAKPQYGLMLLDAEGKSRVWIILDKSSADAPHHDILYLDRNGNGDLTEEGERFSGAKDSHGRMIIKGADIRLPGSDSSCTEFQVYSSMGSKPGKAIQVKAEGRERLIGGYGLNGELAEFGESPAKAPVYVASLKAPISFLLYRETVFVRGASERIAVFAGFAGSGTCSFVAVDENYLVPEKDFLSGTWIAKDAEGREFQERFRIQGHC